MRSKVTVAILIPAVWSVRNIVHSGILRDLTERGWQVHLIMWNVDQTEQLQQCSEDFELAASIHSFKSVKIHYGLEERIRTSLSRILAIAYNRRNGIGSFSILRRNPAQDTSSARRIKNIMYDVMGEISKPWWIFKRLFEWQTSLYRRTHDLSPVRVQLQSIQPDLVWSTVSVIHSEYPYILAAEDLGIRVITSILSFDNLTSRSILPLYDKYLVWNLRMKEQVLSFYPQIDESQVEITGTPQFDFHTQSKFVWTREETAHSLGINPIAPYIIYCANSAIHTPSEPQLVMAIINECKRTPLLEPYQWVVRVHPLDSYERWETTSNLSGVKISYPWAKTGESWALPSLKEVALLSNTLRFASATLAMASTIALDCAVVNTPIICVGFNSVAPAQEDSYYHDVHFTDHYSPIMDSGAAPMATTMDELIKLICDAIEHPAGLTAERAVLAKNEAGVTDISARARVVQALDGEKALIRVPID